jgi:hypothetical protein
MAAQPATTPAIESSGRRNARRTSITKKAQMNASGIRATDLPLNSSSFNRAAAARTVRLMPFF